MNSTLISFFAFTKGFEIANTDFHEQVEVIEHAGIEMVKRVMSSTSESKEHL